MNNRLYTPLLLGQTGFFLVAINLIAKSNYIEYAATLLIVLSLLAICIYGKKRELFKVNNVIYLLLEASYLVYIFFKAIQHIN